MAFKPYIEVQLERGTTNEEAVKDLIHLSRKIDMTVTCVVDGVRLQVTPKSDVISLHSRIAKINEVKIISEAEESIIAQPPSGVTIYRACELMKRLAVEKKKVIMGKMNDVDFYIRENTDLDAVMREYNEQVKVAGKVDL